MTLSSPRRCQGFPSARASNCCAVSFSAGAAAPTAASRPSQTKWPACSRRVAHREVNSETSITSMSYAGLKSKFGRFGPALARVNVSGIFISSRGRA